MTETLSYRVDDGENVFIPAKSNGNDKEVGEKEDEVSNAEAGKEKIEDVVKDSHDTSDEKDVTN